MLLKDPNRIVPFPIVNEGTDTRYLTGRLSYAIAEQTRQFARLTSPRPPPPPTCLAGADFDIESIQPVGSSFFFGDEFG